MLFLFVFLFLLSIGNGQAQPAPLRAGIDIRQPTLIKSVPVTYLDPQPEWGIGAEVRIVLSVIIDKQGAVADISDVSGYTLYYKAYYEAAKSSVKQWLFSTTFVNGKPVSVSTTIAIIFSTIGTPWHLDWHSSIGLPLGNRASMCSFIVSMGPSGNLQETADENAISIDSEGHRREMSQKQFCGTERHLILSPDSDAPFSMVEERMNAQEPVAFSLLHSSKYRYPYFDSYHIEYVRSGLKRLYYSTIVTSGDSIIQLAGIDPEVKAPAFASDFRRLVEPHDGSTFTKGVVFFYTLFVDEAGKILGVEWYEEKNESVVRALSEAVVITPGTRNGKPVPTAVIVGISEKAK